MGGRQHERGRQQETRGSPRSKFGSFERFVTVTSLFRGNPPHFISNIHKAVQRSRLKCLSLTTRDRDAQTKAGQSVANARPRATRPDTSLFCILLGCVSPLTSHRRRRPSRLYSRDAQTAERRAGMLRLGCCVARLLRPALPDGPSPLVTDLACHAVILALLPTQGRSASSPLRALRA